MTYIDLLNEFWNQDRFNPYENVDTKLYLLLLDESNIRRWINPIALHTYYLEERLRIKRKAIGEARNRLKQRGLIDFVSKPNNPTIFLIENVEISNQELFQLFPERNNRETIGKQLGNNRETIGKHNIKTNKTNKTLDSEDTPSVGGAFDSIQISLFPEEEKKPKRKSGKATPPAPTLEEVLDYFLSQDADKRLENWEESARRFYDNFNAVDWRDKFNRRITRWDSRANSWILDDESRQKEKRDETKQTDRLSERRGTEPSSKARKGFKGTF
ncbi:MAG: hypothetical protein K2M59_03710 [Muribaculaceae bacterium]|nr:hypothetical protein [Muribaculaceae bacterium]MDE7465516.1 hypothetical protein [Muribaculaceae bacterium]